MQRKRDIEALTLASERGVDVAAQEMGISREAVRRMARRAKGSDGEPVEAPDSLLRRIMERYSPAELRALASGSGINPAALRRPAVNFTGDKMVIGFCTDTHIGEESFFDELWAAFIFFRGCAIKYLWRSGRKAGVSEEQDLQKAVECRQDRLAYLAANKK